MRKKTYLLLAAVYSLAVLLGKYAFHWKIADFLISLGYIAILFGILMIFLLGIKNRLLKK